MDDKSVLSPSLDDILQEFSDQIPDPEAAEKDDSDEKAQEIFHKIAAEVKLGDEGVLDLFPRRAPSPSAEEIMETAASRPEIMYIDDEIEYELTEHTPSIIDIANDPDDEDQPGTRVGDMRIDYAAMKEQTDTVDNKAPVATKPPKTKHGTVADETRAETSPEKPKRPAIWAWEGSKIDEGTGDELIDETPLPSALKHYSKSVKSLRPRLAIAFVLCLIPVYITLAAGFNFWLPDFLTVDIYRWVLFGFNAVLMALCYDMVAKGVYDLLRMRCGYETLAVIASVVTMVHAAIGNSQVPYCAVSTISLFIALRGNYLKKSAIRRTFKTAASAKEAYGVVRAEDGYDELPAFFKTKTAGQTEGFVNMTESEDCAEKAFSYYVPIMVVFSVVFSAVTWLSKDLDPLYVLAACMAAGLPLGGMLCYAMPFDSLSKRMSHIGSALAGWKGALSMCGPASIVLTDADLFPKKTISFNGSDGLKIYGDFTPERLISYTSAMLIRSGSGLARLFEDIADLEHLPRIDEFQHYESGGLGADIRGDVVLVGSYSFMMLMGVRIPQDSKVKSAAYIAINGLPAGVFSMDYKPADLIQDSLKALIREKNLGIVLATRDFTITPTMVKRCFKVSSDPLELPTVEQRVDLSDPNQKWHGTRGALICREGLPAFADAVVGGRLLKKTCLFNTAFSIIGSLLGLFIMFFLMFTTSYAAASAAHVLLYTLAFMLPVLIVSSWANRF